MLNLFRESVGLLLEEFEANKTHVAEYTMRLADGALNGGAEVEVYLSVDVIGETSSKAAGDLIREAGLAE